jgi:hypothetical protein
LGKLVFTFINIGSSVFWTIMAVCRDVWGISSRACAVHAVPRGCLNFLWISVVLLMYAEASSQGFKVSADSDLLGGDGLLVDPSHQVSNVL